MLTMKLTQALKKKNRLAGEIKKLQNILYRENARRNDNKSTVNREEVWNKINSISQELGLVKSAIAEANVPIYSKLERMAELKSMISFIQTLPTREGEEISFIGRDQERLTYTWNSFINQKQIDELVDKIQKEIDQHQDAVDAFNATTEVLVNV
jgi:hypothetical protein